MPCPGLCHAAGSNEFDQTKLNGIVPVLLPALLLDHHAGAGLQNRDRDDPAVFIKDLAHPHLYANKSVDHVFPLTSDVLRPTSKASTCLTSGVGRSFVLRPEGFDLNVDGRRQVQLH